MLRHTFAKDERLKKNDSIKKVFDKGIPYKCKSINIYLLKRDDGSTTNASCHKFLQETLGTVPSVPYYQESKSRDTNRAAFVVRKKLYNKKSVLRNRFRRILKEAYRRTKHLLPPGYDIVILGANIRKTTKSTDIEREITYVFKKLCNPRR